MENERDLTCRQHLKYSWENNRIVCHTCGRSWKQHDVEGPCGAAIYHDERFSPIPQNLYYQPNIHAFPNVKWARISDFSVNAIFNTWDWSAIMNSARPQDAVQGRMEDGWLIAAMAVLPRNRDALRNLFPSYQNYPKGMYSVRLYSFGSWNNVLVDDFVPCDANFQPFHAKVYRMWAGLIEKAVAKFYGSYEALHGGTIVESLNLLTGAPSTYISLSEELDLRFTPHRFWNRLGYGLDENYLILAQSAGNTKKINADEEFVNMGLLKLHAYCVLNIRIVREKRLIKLLNPNCVVEYKGPWSYEYLNNEPVLQERLYQECNEREFWMDYDIFLEYFEGVCVSKIRDDYNKIPVNGTLHPLLMKCPAGIYFTIKKRTVVDFVLNQKTRRWVPAQNRFLMDLFFLIFKMNPNGNYYYFAHSARVVATLVSLELELHPGEYFVVPVTFNHFAKINIEPQHLQCVLEMFTKDMVFTDKKWYPFDKLKETLVNMAKEIGKTKRCRSAFLYEHSNGFDGVAVVAENRERRRWLSVTCVYVGEPDKYESTRGVLTTRDIIPPHHTQIIAVLTLNRGTHDAGATYFDYQFDVVGQENPLQQPKHLPFINYRTDPIHRPYVHKDR